MDDEIHKARVEIYETLRLCNLFISPMGISLVDDLPTSLWGRFKMHFGLVFTTFMIFGVVLGEFTYIGNVMREAAMNMVGSNFHVALYGVMSAGKLITLWHKRHMFRKLVANLADIWPVTLKDEEASTVKKECLAVLKFRQFLYIFFNGVGLMSLAVSPFLVLVYHKLQGAPAQIGYMFLMLYPFDKTKPLNHGIAYIFEVWAGVMCVCVMVGTHLLFITMSGNIGMLLRLLQVKIRNLVPVDPIQSTNEYKAEPIIDCYSEIIDVVKVHQRLINYLNDLEDAFSVVNLINVLISTVNLCCVTFNIVFLDPLLEMSNKFFLGAALTEMGVLCFYADDIYRASVAVSDAVYESAWYRTDIRCRKALLLVLQRAQKPMYFTTMKFSPITMETYSSILTTSFSYFTLLHSSYSTK